MCLRLDSTEIPIIADTTTPKLVKLESKKKSRKILVWKEIKEKEKWNKKSKVLIREYLVAYYYYDIVVDFRALLISLFWFDPNNIFFRRLAFVSLLAAFFFGLCTHKTFQWVRWKSIFFLVFFSTRFTHSRALQLPIQQNLSVFYTPHLSASSFTGFRCSHIDVDDDDEHVNLQ